MTLNILSGGQVYLQTGQWLQGWGFQAGGVGSDNALDIAIDSGGNKYIAGQFQETASF